MRSRAAQERLVHFCNSVLRMRMPSSMPAGIFTSSVLLFLILPWEKALAAAKHFQVASIDDVMRSWYRFKDRVPIAFGPGRHATSGAIFLYFRGPDGVIFEYSHGVGMIEDEQRHRPRQFPAIPSSFCVWGATPDIDGFR